MNVKEFLRLKRLEADIANQQTIKKGNLVITQINKHLRHNEKPTPWFESLMYKGVKRSIR